MSDRPNGGLIGWERELIDPDYRPPAYYVSMETGFATRDYGFPTPLRPGVEVTAYDGSVWVFDNLGAGHWDMTDYPPTGDPYGVIKDRERNRPAGDSA